MVTVAAFYRFIAIEDPAALQAELRSAFTEEELRGTLLIAPEGINGTLAASSEVIERLLTLLAERTGLERPAVKFSRAAENPFGRLKFKVKQEILAFRRAVVDPSKAGTYVAPKDWNALIADPEVLVLDTRNTYETEVGTFRGAVDPKIETFSEFATYARNELDPARHTKVAMFCTGGIRCEKASAFLLQEGFAEVYHLEGGILRYLEEIPVEESTWIGECFVFDRRREVGSEDLGLDQADAHLASPTDPSASVPSHS
ncbi:rhodanese-related sulfurtransferase [Granulicella sibirica]|uniref:tRNA uridine(34) hydroxylase n=1 Tax=Granulicella sibirica TaxID=2479048 RepID=A0A4Q0SZ98_9BACT|nr:rhodanese-related sulfurtransferase [Granulicella sibirica]RXH56585.1 Rhodanese domain protein UPF0176, cyanobacterial/alphaproteobacterial subgroup [Granulicella sibirica]